MRKSQQGASYIAVLFGVILFAIAVKAAVAIWPVYWDDKIIDTQIKGLLKDSPENISPTKFYNQMDQRLEMNNVREIHFKDIALVTYKNDLLVKKKYEVRKPFMFNVSLVMTFEKTFDQKSAKQAE
ncbi:DUF4845 domain-containing protein [Acinetobacter venetianus]|uniref:DUF4845 domain-containing protein n=1 Tax=Acinetobacter venetianus (strain ATCC 31012 / DSM 23050 / BCRC 14357 / CCUG 45561 / CIP 110063 / KCTC 2702 / LMG 19082 / RAG-1) TaxID=1191460 RepID=N9A216_ACIVR|nr:MULTISPECIES: DUF4845 domain-containing protein [Acinetobacter]ENV37840.1 hypothetical protein F959_01360 [Acinetobacter venetianus RAG-1 = CIP 110063]KXO83225.1 hypothetical protein AYK86_09255 [Acinetobacter venetianus]KXZ63634.1 hypothetical protein AVENLUH7437_02398 [Acinetobacter venetianus]KXZ75332.1 hypothetical protein AVENLUH8758_00181 [Acinetobacter venetianus]QNH52204.1 DUF4845 domain-containing protein [Acinetobacter venetianus]